MSAESPAVGPPSTPPSVSEFMDAVKENDLEGVRERLSKDPQLLHSFDHREFGSTPLNLAVSRDLRRMAEALLEAGADPERKSEWWAGGFTALHTAIDRGNREMAQRLIDLGAQVDVHTAAALGKLGRLRSILDRDPKSVMARGGDGQFPLHFAHDAEVADLLLERGADLEGRDIDHCATPAQWALGRSLSVCRHLIDRGARQDVFMLSAVGDARRLKKWLEQHPEEADSPLSPERFPSPGSQGGHIYTYSIGMGDHPLHAAARWGQAESARVLIEAGADLDAAGGYEDQTPLHLCAWEGSRSVARLLIGAGAELESRTSNGATPLRWAIASGEIELVRLLLESGARVDDSHRETGGKGVRGEFDQYKTAAPSVRQEIQRLISPDPRPTGDSPTDS